ncbi:MAG: NDP-sugar synthase [Acidimicrobiia bacterium]|nr:NDP-sugar synthase [Acidimicrobiia bacterium]MXZ86693.1 NDP-sugar synthase [Acidimicrobiia bacterium]MYE72217.1 NDP-sugar synthase [Acidimicrobiia bacterium]MYG71299.1 NDP-sugar synthase [Acidimicrobiia bacterium]MYJ61070.1 NDP-sugar synthase [Acidimicrobiia bacterium]
MDAVVLVGGFGTRLRPLTLTRPKQMLPVVDRPMIEHVVGRLGEQGVTRAVLSLGYRPDAFEAAYPEHRCAGVELFYAVEPEPLDTAGAIAFAARMAEVDDTFIAVNGDVISDFPLVDLVDAHRGNGAAATIALTPVEDPSRYGVVVCDSDGKVQAFVEKPPADETPSQWINAGMYVLDPSVLDLIPENRPTSIERETFPALVQKGSLYAVARDGFWIDAGTPEAFLEVQIALAGGTHIHPTAEIAPSARITNSVIMDHAAVAEGARIADSVLLPYSTVQAGADINRAIISPDHHINV